MIRTLFLGEKGTGTEGAGEQRGYFWPGPSVSQVRLNTTSFVNRKSVARYYSPYLARFVSPDTIVPEPWHSGAFNRYTYGYNNPVKFVDPSGHCGVSSLGLLGPNGPVNFVEKCLEAWNRAITAYQAGERRPLVLASHVYGVTDWLVEQSEAIDQLNADADVVFSNACFEDRILPSVRLGLWSTETAGTIVGIGQIAKAAIGARQTTQQILQDLANQADAAVPGRGPIAGTRKHTDFGNRVRNLGRPDLRVEQSYLNGQPVNQNLRGSVRLDVVEGPLNNPTAVYDLKTGSARLSAARIQQIQNQLPNPNTPVIEIRPN